MLQQSDVLLTLRYPKLLKVGPQKCSAEWDKHLPRHIGYAAFHTPQDTVGPSGYQRTLLTHIQLASNPNPQMSFHRAALQPFITQLVCTTRITPPLSGGESSTCSYYIIPENKKYLGGIPQPCKAGHLLNPFSFPNKIAASQPSLAWADSMALCLGIILDALSQDCAWDLIN